MDERLARSPKPRQRVERSAGTRERQVSHVARAANRDAEAGEIVVAPEGPVDEHKIAAGKPREHAMVQPSEARHVADSPSARSIAEHEPTRLELLARPLEVPRRVPAHLEP